MAESIDAVLVRAAQLTADGRPRAAIELLRPVLVVHPEHSSAWCRLSVAYLDAGDVTQSLDAAKRAIVLGERSWAHRLASLALIELDRFDEAVASAREAVKREPLDWRCHVTLAESLAPKSPKDAVAAARRAVDLAPREARPLEVLGDVAARAADTQLARRSYQDALRLDPGNEHIAASLGRLGAAPQKPPKRAPAKPARPVRFGTAQRRAVWLMARRVSSWQFVGAFVLLIAGMPSPSRALMWFAFAVVLAVFGELVRAWLSLIPGARIPPAQLRRAEPLIAVAGGLFVVAALCLVIWTIALTFGSRGMQLLTVVLGGSGLATVVSWLRLRSLRIRI
jgi:tetratricopeptide (TPR) repeat protein